MYNGTYCTKCQNPPKLDQKLADFIYFTIYRISLLLDRQKWLYKAFLFSQYTFTFKDFNGLRSQQISRHKIISVNNTMSYIQFGISKKRDFTMLFRWSFMPIYAKLHIFVSIFTWTK